MPSGAGFRCKRGEFVSFWKKGRIQRECAAHLARCWFVVEDEKFRGYITLFSDCLSVEKALLEGEDVRYKTFPAVKIGLLAVDERTKGLGTQLVNWAFIYIAGTLAPQLGVRYVTVDALCDPDTGYDTAPFYEKFGFIHADTSAEGPRRFRTMFYDLKTIFDAQEKV